MDHIIDLDRYPLHMPHSADWEALVAQCKAGLARDGLFNLPGFMQPTALADVLEHVHPRMETESFHHRRAHNIYFKDAVEGLAPDDPALKKVETANHTLCHDQMRGTALDHLYLWPEFATFLAAVMDKPQLFTMDDALAGLNVLEYRPGEALNWHFDRSIFTTTLLLQEASAGGHFEYVKDLRSEDDPNHAGIADLLEGRIAPTTLIQSAGTLNVFLGLNTAHRVSTVGPGTSRIVAVLSHYDSPGRAFTAEEQMGFFGRVA
ncbi:2OG-Fe(II) oxygenase [Tateyamaria sp. ANG-S1]|uniref:2OG-Fe(II) oxygenase n=1 Tax=Tateyamaria sp. ANG-S1 TaxID=1577905 RepID=UPI00057EA7E9|nr:2OG-Fe(II) oxygenase [Tateyamaria sp. ANG-S1]KIC50906.1 2OG-Fe(II) oxygenase [Tateyamaria sp. ANG-S1]